MEKSLVAGIQILRQKIRFLKLKNLPVPKDDRLDKLICDLYELDAYLDGVFQTCFITYEKRYSVKGCFNSIQSDLDKIDFESEELDQIVAYINQLKELVDIYNSL